MGPLPNGESILVIVDYFSRYYEVAFQGSTTTERIIEYLIPIFFALANLLRQKQIMCLILFPLSSKHFQKNMELNIVHHYRCGLGVMEKSKDKIGLY